MQRDFQLFPESATDLARSIDHLHLFILVVSLFFATLIAGLVIFFSVRYRRGRQPRPSGRMIDSTRLEVLWTVIPFVLAMAMFAWGATLYSRVMTPPAEGMRFYVTGVQWKWKIQHPSGQREINQLHVPVGRDVVLTMISEDVIHSFYVPAFRVKHDVLPGRYTNVWFHATKPGRYHLFCAEYCGTKHAEMIGEVVVMEAADYERWLSGRPAAEDPVEAGRALFERLRCNTCHEAGPSQRGPSLVGVAGRPVQLADGSVVVADADYLRESILMPARRITAGYEPLMPSYAGQLGEEEVLLLIAYIESLATPAPGAPEGGAR